MTGAWSTGQARISRSSGSIGIGPTLARAPPWSLGTLCQYLIAMLAETPGGASEARSSRLIVEPPAPVGRSVLPLTDPEAAAAHASDAGRPVDLLARCGATVRQTHRRANVIVVDVPAARQAALIDALRAIGISA